MSGAATLLECFADLPDPRVERTRKHRLLDILVIALCAVLCGAEGWDDIVEFAQAKRDWLQERLELPSGIPCADTFRRVFARLQPEAFQTCFLTWIQAVQATTRKVRADKHIAVDGKSLRHSFDTAAEQTAIHLVSAWASHLRLVLGQVQVADKSNEITAVPALLALLDLNGCIVTADAMSCQKAIAKQIIGQGGHYLLSLKGNQDSLYEDVGLLFAYAKQHGFQDLPHQVAKSVDKGHGRIETRCVFAVDLDKLEGRWQDVQAEWAGLSSLVMVERHTKLTTKTRTETAYYISSLPGNAARLARAIRGHWGIENKVHWVLDAVFDEDACRIRKDNAPQNFAVLRHIALNLLRQEKTHQRGIKAKQKRAGWDNDYLTQLLTN